MHSYFFATERKNNYFFGSRSCIVSRLLFVYARRKIILVLRKVFNLSFLFFFQENILCKDNRYLFKKKVN